jgi:transposase
MSVAQDDNPVRMRGRGAKRLLTPEQEKEVLTMYTSTKVPVDRIAAVFKVSRRTIYNVIRRLREPTEAA